MGLVNLTYDLTCLAQDSRLEAVSPLLNYAYYPCHMLTQACINQK